MTALLFFSRFYTPLSPDHFPLPLFFFSFLPSECGTDLSPWGYCRCWCIFSWLGLLSLYLDGTHFSSAFSSLPLIWSPFSTALVCCSFPHVFVPVWLGVQWHLQECQKPFAPTLSSYHCLLSFSPPKFPLSSQASWTLWMMFSFLFRVFSLFWVLCLFKDFSYFFLHYFLYLFVQVCLCITNLLDSRLSILHIIICEFFPSQSVTQWAHLVIDSVSQYGKIQGDGRKFLDRFITFKLFWVKNMITIIKWDSYLPITAKICNKEWKKKKKKNEKKRRKKVELETRLATLSFWLQMLMQNTKRPQQYTLIRVNVKLVTCGGWPSQQSQTRNRNWCALLVSYHRHFHSERFASVGSVSSPSIFKNEQFPLKWKFQCLIQLLAKIAFHNNFSLWRLTVFQKTSKFLEIYSKTYDLMTVGFVHGMDRILFNFGHSGDCTR